MKDRTVRKLLKYLSKSRYNLCEIYEEFRILETVVEQKTRWEQNRGAKPKKPKKNTQKEKTEKQKQNERMKKLHLLMKKWFNYSKGKAQTRESKIKLNQDDDQKKVQLLNGQDMKFPIADNR